jgi:transposase-like protein
MAIEIRGTIPFDDLCEHFAKEAPTFIAQIAKKRDHYLHFLKCPEGIRRSLSTTNAVEAVNGQLEIMRRNNGGYFQSERVLKVKLGIAMTSLTEGTWKKPAASVCAALPQFIALFSMQPLYFWTKIRPL